MLFQSTCLHARLSFYISGSSRQAVYCWSMFLTSTWIYHQSYGEVQVLSGKERCWSITVRIRSAEYRAQLGSWLGKGIFSMNCGVGARRWIALGVNSGPMITVVFFRY